MIEAAEERIQKAKKFATELNQPILGSAYASALECQLKFMEEEFLFQIKKLEEEAV